MKERNENERLLPCELRRIIRAGKRVKARAETLRRKNVRNRNLWRTA